MAPCSPSSPSLSTWDVVKSSQSLSGVRIYIYTHCLLPSVARTTTTADIGPLQRSTNDKLGQSRGHPFRAGRLPAPISRRLSLQQNVGMALSSPMRPWSLSTYPIIFDRCRSTLGRFYFKRQVPESKVPAPPPGMCIEPVWRVKRQFQSSSRSRMTGTLRRAGVAMSS